jgi:hypothetical protein
LWCGNPAGEDVCRPSEFWMGRLRYRRALHVSREDAEQLADIVPGLGGVTERLVRMDHVRVPSALAVDGQVAGILEVADDRPGRAFGDPGLGGEVPESCVRVRGDEEEQPTVVREQGPGAGNRVCGWLSGSRHTTSVTG